MFPARQYPAVLSTLFQVANIAVMAVIIIDIVVVTIAVLVAVIFSR